ncbi:polysaccharide biosynthesis tyrosine autokinase [Deinococcus maricopensis]|uniref:Lipopolysaccharide biosynthesis protein n=1 Tax=Deinococcus maricopensis (strain DSM 21211 / LMG 22137 / NRRL B-23946 / LB-34) TaxID=709986 RepID=E8U3D9_DEIML|nr:tyrosine-protein kinase domain-containing protein [Deinococcus maricopensis]ADV65810.1 lipopolysaccharide biosynthesis protein [Deinococcus maricopensis DSM 21211]
MNDLHTPDVIDLTRSWQALQRSAWIMLLCAAVVGGAVYALFKQQTPIYEASTILLSASNQTGNQTVNSTLVSAPPLPPGALEGALSNINVIRDINVGVRSITSLSPAERNELQRDLVAGATGQGHVIRVTGSTDIYGNGTYTLQARHPNARVAARLANLATDALVAWDAQRGREKVTSARRALEAQLRDLETRLQREGPLGATLTRNQRLLLDQRANRTDELNNLLALERAVVGSLAVVAPAVPPVTPVEPRPTRNAIIAGLFALFVSGAFVLARAALTRTITSDADLHALNLRLIGEVPRLRRAHQGQSLLAMMHRGKATDSVAYLANAVRAQLPERPNIILMTSLLPGDGKSTLSAGLASSLAASGQRTLLLEADLRHPTQRSLWGIAADTADWVNMPGAAPFPGEEARDLQAALLNPAAAQAMKLRDNLHLIVTPTQLSSSVRLNTDAFAAALRIWSPAYDVVVIDAPPVLAVADPLAIAPHVGGVLIVLEPGKAPARGVQRLLDALELANANVLGVAFNKINPRHAGSAYGYGYGYGADARPTRRGA